MVTDLLGQCGVPKDVYNLYWVETKKQEWTNVSLEERLRCCVKRLTEDGRKWNAVEVCVRCGVFNFISL